MPKIERTNVYIFNSYTRSEDALYPLLSISPNEENPDGIGIDFLNFLNKNISCAKCKAPINDLLINHHCEIKSKNHGYDFKIQGHLEIEFIEHLHRHNSRIASRENAAQRNFAKSKTKHKHTKQDIEDLRRLQENRCYYCLASFSEKKVHIDHVLALSNGGDDSARNLVLACQACNIIKGAQSFERFLQTAIAKLSVEEQHTLKEMHKVIKKHKRTLPQQRHS
jgi:5-methylcytosine-specific restriction endonuclease McrA